MTKGALFRDVADIAPELWLDALAREPLGAARATGAAYDPERGFAVPFMGGVYAVHLGRRSIVAPAGHKPANFQKGLVLLAYLAHGQDIGLSGRLVSSRDLNGGAMFFTGPHALLAAPVLEKFGRDGEGFLARAGELGFRPSAAAGGAYGCQGPVLPYVAMGMTLYPQDDEFPAELTYTFDSYAHFHLPLDAIWAMVNVLAEELAYGLGAAREAFR